MPELMEQAFRARYGDRVPAMVQLAFYGDDDHSDNSLVEAVARRVAPGDICILDGYIVLSQSDAVDAIARMLPKPLVLESVVESLIDKAERIQATPPSILKTSGYAPKPKATHPRLEYAMLQNRFKQNTGFMADKIFNAVRRSGATN